MKKNFVPPYDEDYAKQYDTLWSENKLWHSEVIYTQQLVRRLLKDKRNWLDAGCGTGYLLKSFEGFKRAGFDLSETMLDVAKKANPDALFFETHDISVPKEEWNNKWDLVTSTGQPWSYLKDIRLIEKTVENLYNWTNDKNGVCMIVPDDMQNAFNVSFKYQFSEYTNKNYPNALIWTYSPEDSGDKHLYLIYPLLDQWVRWFSRYFQDINIEYKTFEPHTMPRLFMICSLKKVVPNVTPVNISFNGISLEILEKKFGKDNLNNATLFFQNH